MVIFTVVGSIVVHPNLYFHLPLDSCAFSDSISFPPLPPSISFSSGTYYCWVESLVLEVCCIDPGLSLQLILEVRWLIEALFDSPRFWGLLFV